MKAATTPCDADVLVLGAGLAGLYAAMELEAAGFDALVVEASAIIGGRIRTIFANGKPIDIGGTGLGPSHLRARAMADVLSSQK